MKVLIDGDGCPVIDISIHLCQKYHIFCLLLCDTAHEFHRDGAETLIIDKGADSVDYALVNRIEAGDLVITQDYGLASMCLAKGARILHQDGWEYTDANIDALLFQRYESRKFRSSGGHIKGPHKRTFKQNEDFEKALASVLQKLTQG